MAHEPVSSEVLQERWRMATTGLRRYSNESGVSWDLSKRWYRIDRALEEFAALLVEDGVLSEEFDEDESLQQAKESIWYHIEDTLLTWAMRTGERRTAIFAKKADASGRLTVPTSVPTSGTETTD